MEPFCALRRLPHSRRDFSFFLSRLFSAFLMSAALSLVFSPLAFAMASFHLMCSAATAPSSVRSIAAMRRSFSSALASCWRRRLILELRFGSKAVARVFALTGTIIDPNWMSSSVVVGDDISPLTEDEPFVFVLSPLPTRGRRMPGTAVTALPFATRPAFLRCWSSFFFSAFCRRTASRSFFTEGSNLRPSRSFWIFALSRSCRVATPCTCSSDIPSLCRKLLVSSSSTRLAVPSSSFSLAARCASLMLEAPAPSNFAFLLLWLFFLRCSEDSLRAYFPFVRCHASGSSSRGSTNSRGMRSRRPLKNVLCPAMRSSRVSRA